LLTPASIRYTYGIDYGLYYLRIRPLTSIIQKRRSLHKKLAHTAHENDLLHLQVSQLQALANIGVATSMIAHEINNLLTPLWNYAALASSNPDDVQLAAKALQKTERGCKRASEVMQAILAVANGETREKLDTPLLPLVEEIFNCLCRDFSKDSITLTLDIPERLTVRAVPVEIQQVLMNLILNARDAMLGRGGYLTIAGRQQADIVHISVSDTGSGIAPENIDRIFDPFFTTKGGPKSAAGSGSGLGLAFVKRVIDAHRGSISVKSEPGNGTTFLITLPAPD
jgi:signal transduction histidine kinase